MCIVSNLSMHSGGETMMSPPPLTRAPSRERWVVNGQTTKASDKSVHPSPLLVNGLMSTACNTIKTLSTRQASAVASIHPHTFIFSPGNPRPHFVSLGRSLVRCTYSFQESGKCDEERQVDALASSYWSSIHRRSFGVERRRCSCM